MQKLFVTKAEETFTIAEAREMRLLKQQRKMTSAAPSKKKAQDTTVLTVAFWKRDAAPTVPPTG